MTGTAVDPRSAYEIHLSAKAAAWRAKYPARADRLRVLVAKLLGWRVTHKISPSLVGAACEPHEEQIIAAMQGWPTEAEWKPDA